MENWFSGFHFDWRTSLITLIGMPLLYWILSIIRKHFKTWAFYLLEGVLYHLSRHINHSLAASLSVRRYCKIQLGIQKYKKLYVPSRFDINLDIDKMYVPLTLKKDNFEDKTFNHSNFLLIGNRIKVMGDPGSGKSTLAKKVFRDSLQKCLKMPRKAKFPILVELKNIPATNDPAPPSKEWLFNHLRDEIARNKVYEMASSIESYARNSGLLLIMDGLDEVASTKYAWVEKAINDLSHYLDELGSNNIVIFTVRTQYYHQIKGGFQHSFPDAVYLKSFTPSDIYDFLSRWEFGKEADAHIARIYKELTDKPTLREMCRNPLILSMYVAEDQASGGNIAPETRTEFYRKVTEELMIYRRLQQKSSAGYSHTSLKEQRERILGRIAYQHLTNMAQPKNTLSWKDAIGIIKELQCCDDHTAAEIFNEICKETGLITEERYQETYRFIHLTFCEFLAAFETIQDSENGWNQLMSVYYHFTEEHPDDISRLLEVIPFAAGLAPRSSKSKCLHDVAALNNPMLMARCFLETKQYNHPTWPLFIGNLSYSLSKFGAYVLNEQWFNNLHIFNVIVNDAEAVTRSLPVVKNIDLTQFYESLLQQQKDQFGDILQMYATQDAAAVLRLSEISTFNLVDELPEIVTENADQLPFLGLIREKIINSPSPEREKWAALAADAALRKKVVARYLDAMPAVPKLDALFKQDKRYRNWAYEGMINNTFLCQCFTLTTKASLTAMSFPYLKLLLQLQTPREWRSRLVSTSVMVTMALHLFYYCILFVWASPVTFLTIQGTGLYLFIDLSIFISIKGLFKITAFLFYEQVFNLRSATFLQIRPFRKTLVNLLFSVRDAALLNHLDNIREIDYRPHRSTGKKPRTHP